MNHFRSLAMRALERPRTCNLNTLGTRFLCGLLCTAFLFITGCRPDQPSATSTPQVEWSPLEGAAAALWQQAGIPDEGKISLVGGELTLAAGQPMTGARWEGWDASLPSTDYAIEYEAMRVDGEDIFGMVTFPVGSHDSHATFVIGGWGGTVTGISSLDFNDANENQTRAEQRFENGRWYRVRVEVRPQDLRAWVEERLVVNANIRGRQVGLRPGFIDHCLPFGFATYGRTGKIRLVVIQKLEN